jgi:ankyrin repeat protein
MAPEDRFLKRRLIKLLAVGAVFLAAGLLMIGYFVRFEEAEEKRLAIVQAAQHGTPEEVKALLDQGSDPNTRDLQPEDPPPGLLTRLSRAFSRWKRPETGMSLLTLAQDNQNHRYEMTALLLSRGASVKTDKTGRPVLFWPARNGDFKTVRLLVEHGADVNEVDTVDFTPLLGAMLSKDRTTVNYLLDHGAKVTPTSKTGMEAGIGSTLDLAKEWGDKEVIRRIIAARKRP